MKSKRIALFMLPLLTQGGGAEKYFISLARELSQRDIETDIITMDENFFRKFARLLHIFALGDFFGKIDILGREKEKAINKQLGSAQWLKTDFKNLRKLLSSYDIVYAKNELVDLFLLKLAGYRRLPPVIVGVHTPVYFPKAKAFVTKMHNFLYLGFLYRWLLRGAKCLHVSNRSAKELADKNFKIKNKLVYYPFSADEIINASRNFVSELVFEKGKFRIAFSGRLSEQKGVRELAGLISKLSAKADIVEKIKINIFGSGGAKHENIVRELEKKYSFVKYFGHIENKLMPNILSRHDLLVSTSLWETLPYNILEAQAMGLPVVSFDIPGPNDIIENKKTGFLVKSGDEFLEKMTDLIEGKAKFSKEVIIQKAREKFNPEKIYSELINMFEEAL